MLLIISSHSQVTGVGELNFAKQFGADIATGPLLGFWAVRSLTSDNTQSAIHHDDRI